MAARLRYIPCNGGERPIGPKAAPAEDEFPPGSGQAQTRGLTGSLFLEFSIPRMGRRIDAVLLLGSVVFVLEFKVGATVPTAEALEQVWDYGLDLKNFHEASHGLPIAPILIPTEAPPQTLKVPVLDAERVY